MAALKTTGKTKRSPGQRRAAGCLILGLTGLLGLWLLFWWSPLLLQGILSGLLAQREVDVESLPVEKLGFRELQVGESHLRLGEKQLRWQRLQLGYSFSSLLEGRIVHMELTSPELRFPWPPAPPVPPVTAPPDGAKEPFTRPSPEQAPRVPSVGKGPVPAPPVTGEEHPAEPAPLPSRKTLPASFQLPVDLSALVGDLPMRTMRIPEGTVRLAPAEKSERSFDGTALLLRRSGSAEGFVDVSGHGLEGRFYLEQLSRQAELQLQAELSLEMETFMPVWEELTGKGPPAGLVFKGARLEGMALADVRGDELIRTSLKGEGREFTFHHPASGLRIPVAKAVLAGSWEAGKVALEAGVRTGASRSGAISVEPFALKAAAVQGISDWRFSSEAVRFSAKSFEGKLALRGKAERVWTVPRVATELQFTSIGGKGIRFGPFTVQLEGDSESLSLQCPSLSLEREGTLWIEEVAGELFPTVSLRAGLFGLAGTQLATLHAERLPAGKWRLGWEDPAGVAGEIRVRRSPHPLPESVQASGQLPVALVHNLARWGGVLPGKLEGGALSLDADLKRAGLGFLRGSLRLRATDLDLHGDEDWEATGFSGELALAVIGLPRTEGRQHWRMEEFRHGALRLREVELEWEMPHLREIMVHRLTGLLEGAELRLVPFSFDPAEPVFTTTAELHALPGQRILGLLEEERFGLEGLLSGSLDLRFDLDGIEIGKGRFALAENTDNTGKSRFRFRDEAFLREHLGKLTGIPETMRTRLQQALLRNGIQIDTLEIRLEEAPAEEKIRLRLEMRGVCRSEELRIPIERFVLNNLIPRGDLDRLLDPGGFLKVKP